MKSYSQCGQDLFVYHINEKKPGKFLDLGCSLPKKINNTYLLELNGWDGISLDILDYNKQWSERKCKFIQADCLNQNYDELLKNYYDNQLIDYLTLDMEGCGDRFKLLEKIINTNYRFKIITIEHDSYMGSDFVNKEKLPQRNLLESKGYKLICGDISHSKHPDLFFEDWWVDPKYFDGEILNSWSSNQTSCDKIFEKMNIEYEVAEESVNR